MSGPPLPPRAEPPVPPVPSTRAGAPPLPQAPDNGTATPAQPEYQTAGTRAEPGSLLLPGEQNTNTWQVVTDSASVQRTASVASEVVRQLGKGDVVLVLEEDSNNGHGRVRIGDGEWTSAKTSDGTVVLRPAPGLVPGPQLLSLFENLAHEWSEFCDRHPQIHMMHEAEKAVLHKVLARKAEVHRRYSEWYDRVLANCSAVMADPSKPGKQKWLASIVCNFVIYSSVISIGVMPVAFSGWLMTKWVSKSAVFVCCMSPFPLLIQCMFASVLSKIDHTNHKVWTLKSMRHPSQGDLLRPRDMSLGSAIDGVSMYSAGSLSSIDLLEEPTVDGEAHDGESDPMTDDGAEVFVKVHQNSRHHVVPRLIREKVQSTVHHEAEQLKDSWRVCVDFFAADEILDVQHHMPDPVVFPPELNVTWKREWLTLVVVFFATSCGVAWSESGMSVLSTCGYEALVYLEQTTGYRLIEHHKSCGSKLYLGLDNEQLKCLGELAPANTQCAKTAVNGSGVDKCRCWTDSDDIIDLAPGQTVSKKECAVRSEVAGLHHFNYGTAEGDFASQCFGVNQTTDTCDPLTIADGLQHSEHWGFWAVINTGASDEVDSCGCNPGSGWSSSDGLCMEASTTTLDEAVACQNFRQGAANYMSPTAIYMLYGMVLFFLIITYSMALSWIEHDLVMPLPICCRKRNASKRARKISEEAPQLDNDLDSVVFAHAKIPHDEEVVAKWRRAVVKVQKRSKRMSPVWLMAMLIVLLGSFVFYGWYIQYAIKMHEETVAAASVELEVTESLMQLEQQSFFLICTEAYQAAVESSLAVQVGEQDSWTVQRVREVCKHIQTPDLLDKHCTEQTWSQIDESAPWLRAVMDLLLASIIPNMVSLAVGESIEILFPKAFPTLGNDNGYVFFFLNYLVSSAVQRYLIFQFSTSKGKDQGDASVFNLSSMFLILYVALAEWIMRVTWKLRKKIMLLLKAECFGTRRKTGLSFENYFETEWNKGVALRAGLDVAKSSVELWAICIVMAAQIIHSGENCRMWSMVTIQILQVLIEYITDVICVKRLVKKHINPVQALINKNKWTTMSELCAFLMVGNVMLFALPQTKGWATTQSLWCESYDVANCGGST